jgi:hypothetical protein
MNAARGNYRLAKSSRGLRLQAVQEVNRFAGVRRRRENRPLVVFQEEGNTMPLLSGVVSWDRSAR